jgi:NhaP-type Na+/H+ or K+/H+ antiporter
VVAFSVFAQGLTITPLLRRLRLLPDEADRDSRGRAQHHHP